LDRIGYFLSTKKFATERQRKKKTRHLDRIGEGTNCGGRRREQRERNDRNIVFFVWTLTTLPWNTDWSFLLFCCYNFPSFCFLSRLSSMSLPVHPYPHQQHISFSVHSLAFFSRTAYYTQRATTYFRPPPRSTTWVTCLFPEHYWDAGEMGTEQHSAVF
jgi:hypothetical protein